MLHLVDRLLVGVLAELAQAPVFEHAGVQEVLVDRRQLVPEDGIEVTQDGRVTLHVSQLRAGAGAETAILASAAKTGN